MSDDRLVEPASDGRRPALRAPRRARPRDGRALLRRLRLLPRTSSRPPAPSPATSAPSPTSSGCRSSSARTTSASCRSARARSSGTRSASTSAPRSTRSSASPRPPARRATPTFYAFTAARTSRRRTSSGAARSALPGVRPGDSVLHGFGLSMFLAGVPVVRALERMGARPIPVGAEAGIGAASCGSPSSSARGRSRARRPTRQYLARAGAEGARAARRRSSGSRSSSAPASPAPGCRRCAPACSRRSAPRSTTCSAALTASCAAPATPSRTPGMHVLGEDCAITTQLVDQETKAPIPLVDGRDRRAREDEPALGGAAAAPGLGRRRLPGAHRRRARAASRAPASASSAAPTTCSSSRASRSTRPRSRTSSRSSGRSTTGIFRIVLDAPPPRVEPPLRISVERGRGRRRRRRAPTLAAELEKILHQRMTVRPEITVVGAGDLRAHAR